MKQIDYVEKDKIIPGLKTGAYSRLSIEDNGCGMSPEVKSQIFNPFFTTKEVGQGTGLGLSVVHGIIKHHQGIINVESEEGRGTTFDIYFPVIQDKPSEKTVVSEPIKKGNGNILCIDDEPYLNTLFERILSKYGFNPTILTDSIKALEIFRNEPDNFDMVITDQGMPGLTGTQLATEILKIRPQIPIILITGYSDLDFVKIRKIGIRHYLRKPIKFDELLKIIQEILELKS